MESYLVFGRTGYAEPLHQLGVLEASGHRRARSDSLARYGSDWVELSLVPEAEVVWLLREKEDSGEEHG